MELPKAVHRVISRGREYFYYQAGRNTEFQGPRIRLPNDPHAPEFWTAIRQAQGLATGQTDGSLNTLIDQYLEWEGFKRLAPGSQYQYRRSLDIARKAWGNLPADGLRPKHVQIMMDGLAATPGKANDFRSAMRVLSDWAIARGKIEQSLAEGVKRYKIASGHKPWTPEQIASIDRLTGMVRRGVMIYLHTGQRGSDVVRLGPTHIDEGGFALTQRKTKRQVWCPIVPELASEMAAWERQPGPFLRQDNGKPYDRKLFWLHFTQQAKHIPELGGVTLHGLRCTAVINLRRRGLSTGQIGDITGMSLQTIERYCRFADTKSSGQAALISLSEHSKKRPRDAG